MIAVVVVRDGELPAGGDESIAECAGRALLIGSGTADAVEALLGVATDVTTVEAGEVRPAAWGGGLAELLADEPVVLLPASANGRDLAPRLAVAMARPLLANAMAIDEHGVELIRGFGWELHRVVRPERFVVTLHPGLRGVTADPTLPPAAVRHAELPAADAARRRRRRRAARRRGHRRPGRGTADRRRRRRARRPGPLRAARRAGCGDRRQRRRHPRDHRPRLGRARPPDRHHRRGRRPAAVPRLRHQRRGAAHQRPRRTRPT